VCARDKYNWRALILFKILGKKGEKGKRFIKKITLITIGEEVSPTQNVCSKTWIAIRKEPIF